MDGYLHCSFRFAHLTEPVESDNSPSRSTDLFRPSWPKDLTPGLWYLGHMKAKNPFLTKFWWLEASARNKWKRGFEQLLTDSSNHQNFVRNGFLASRWPKNQNPWVKAFGHDRLLERVRNRCWHMVTSLFPVTFLGFQMAYMTHSYGKLAFVHWYFRLVRESFETSYHVKNLVLKSFPPSKTTQY